MLLFYSGHLAAVFVCKMQARAVSGEGNIRVIKHKILWWLNWQTFAI